MAGIALHSVTKQYPNGFVAIHSLDLEVNNGEFLILVGPSGCGKSTLLRMIAGLEEITDGEVAIGGRIVNEDDPKDRDIAMVFQNYALYPHMSVRKNISYALRLAKVPKKEIETRVAEAARILGLEALLDNKPGQLSGGQRQRVAMGRAIVRQPSAYLMDEPLSNLDAQLRVQMRTEIARLQRDLGVTTVYVTHDQVEAMTMGHRVAVLKDGLLQQVDTPQALYDCPANLFVAAFIGSPSMNLYYASLASAGNGMALRIGSVELPVPQSLLGSVAELSNRTIVVGIRPESLDQPAEQHDLPDRGILEAKVDFIEALGADLLVHASIDARAAAVSALGQEEALTLLAQGEGFERAPLLARVPSRSRLRPGDSIRFGLHTSHVHLFDPVTGTRVGEAQ